MRKTYENPDCFSTVASYMIERVSLLRQLYHRYRYARGYFSSRYSGYRQRHTFDNVKTYLMFIGYARSGHTLIGSLLNAHPNIVVAHESNALRHIELGVRRNQLYSLILKKDREFAALGRVWTDYQYAVPNQSQGEFDRLAIIGDKSGGASRNRLHKSPELLDKLRETVGVAVKFVHVVRNPYDNISTLSRRTQRPLSACIDKYFSNCKEFVDIENRVQPGHIILIRHESFITEPRIGLRALCNFLEVPGGEAYIDSCAKIVYDKPHRSRFDVKWTDRQIQLVQENMAEFDYLSGYSFDS